MSGCHWLEGKTSRTHEVNVLSALLECELDSAADLEHGARASSVCEGRRLGEGGWWWRNAEGTPWGRSLACPG